MHYTLHFLYQTSLERTDVIIKAVIAENLTKIYDTGKKAVDRLNITIEQGKVFGFLGPNGAGKTTAVKLLSGILTPTEGTCKVLDIEPSKDPEKLHQLCGVLTEHAQMYDNMTGMQNLCFFGAVFGVSEKESTERATLLLEQLELTDAKDRKLGTYSTGMRQRLSLARALIHRPRFLFLDEPTSGLDPESILNVNRMVKNLADQEGTTIFLCTHQLRYAQEICNDYGLIDDGLLLAAGDINHLRSLVFSGMTVSIEADKIPGDMTPDKTEDRRYDFTVNSENEIPDMIKRIVDYGGNIYHVSSCHMSLEEIYFALLDKRKSAEAERTAKAEKTAEAEKTAKAEITAKAGGGAI